jgi:hypothetical protein
MSHGRRHIQILPRAGFLGWWDRRTGRIPVRAPQESVAGIDYSLRNKAIIRVLGGFLEGIEAQQIHSRRTVHVASHFRMPADPGMENRVPEWIAEHLRFGAVDAETGAVHYTRIRAMDVVWGERGIEIFLHLLEPVPRGARLVFAAEVGDDVWTDAAREVPAGLLHVDPGSG